MLCKLKETINPDVTIDICDTTRTLSVTEMANSSKICKLTIKQIPANSVAFTLDHQPSGRDKIFYSQLSCYINRSCGSGVNKSCDLVVITDLGDDNYKILVVDLKSDKPAKKETEKQLLNSELFVRYLIEMIKTHCGIEVENAHYIRTIVTTDKRSMRKNLVHGKTERRRLQNTNYGTTTIQVDGHKECAINYGALC